MNSFGKRNWREGGKGGGNSLVPNAFPLSSQYVPQHVLHGSSLFIPYALAKCCPPFHLYKWAKIKPFILGTIVSFFSVMGQLACCKKKKKLHLGGALGETSFNYYER